MSFTTSDHCAIPAAKLVPRDHPPLPVHGCDANSLLIVTTLSMFTNSSSTALKNTDGFDLILMFEFQVLADNKIGALPDTYMKKASALSYN